MHIPVLLKETIEALNIEKNGNYIDCTMNGGGHTGEILKRNGPEGKVLGIEIDKEIFEKVKKDERLVAVNDSYANLKKIVKETGFEKAKGVLFDVGMSSYHVDQSERGFSFNKDEPLSMSYSGEYSAEGIVNEWKEENIETILKEYGEEKYARKIAKKIVEERKRKRISSTFDLIEIIRGATPGSYHHGQIHFATRTFQALRIAVNDELNNLRSALPQALEVLDRGGRLVAISFHSLEDRIAKEFMKEKEKSGEIRIITSKPIVPGEEEVKSNPRSRSSKLRAGIKI
ncbi:MAG: 16S rRNA (cytosine(1402)-N(4))-methyltransferase RsmH [Candidatus Pacebacteria bacterium]|nr:16S rRNA (cytosine(1402)-N(4))-methyltransferase RsmH [Candidatus Paceibacterota bacterium]